MLLYDNQQICPFIQMRFTFCLSLHIINCTSIIEALELSSFSQVSLCSLLAEDDVRGLKCLDSESLCFAQQHRFLAPPRPVYFQQISFF